MIGQISAAASTMPTHLVASEGDRPVYRRAIEIATSKRLCERQREKGCEPAEAAALAPAFAWRSDRVQHLTCGSARRELLGPKVGGATLTVRFDLMKSCSNAHPDDTWMRSTGGARRGRPDTALWEEWI